MFEALGAAGALGGVEPAEVDVGSMIYAEKPGDGSAREQAASCQRVLGGLANITREYATKRYRSNVMNWGMVPFQLPAEVEVGSMIYAVKPGDGSAREQAASCQRVLGGLANITREYATKRYRSNVMNWGMVPFQLAGEPPFEVGDYVYVPGIRSALDGEFGDISAWVVRADGGVEEVSLLIADMTPEERAIVKAGCLINYNRDRV